VDPALQGRTFKLIQTSVRNQDLIYFFRGFSMNPKAINALREFFETNYNSVRACFHRIDVSLRFRADFSFAGTCLDIHASRDDVYDEVHNPSGCRASSFFSFLTLALFFCLIQSVYTGFSNDGDRAKAEAFFKVRVHGALYADQA